MSENTFDELVQECVTSGFKHRLLYVFVRVSAMDDDMRREMFGDDAEMVADEDAGFVQVLFDAHQPAAHGLNFETVRDSADAHDSTWNMIVISATKNSDRSLPTDDQANGFLTDMRDRIMNGDVGDFTILDRNGNLVGVEAEVVSPAPGN